MIVRINVTISAGQEDYALGSSGNLNFTEDCNLTGTDFAAVSNVFERVHQLIDALKAESKNRVQRNPKP